ncbi:hypothetical protein LSH36_1224g00015 [Paralvinella palmiformis]|uniref:Uncharacterized protein n=1 Tax=Paralvinella palmiformis TaxID=53620 RepID=A0AAD9IUM1_9ANNE|nr:hypothetical protein LSH36_1224g00015 [Paralvinella palmiformis]
MRAAVLLSVVTLTVTLSSGVQAFPTLTTIDKESLISMLLEAPPVAEAACYMKEFTSVDLIINKTCDCDGSTVSCDVGPLNVGDIEVKFCNKTPSQPLENLLVMKFACDFSDPTCGEGLLPPSDGVGICHPEMTSNKSYEGPDSRSSEPDSSSPDVTSATSSDAYITEEVTTSTSATSLITKRPDKRTTSPKQTITTKSVNESSTRRPSERPRTPPTRMRPSTPTSGDPCRSVPTVPSLRTTPPRQWPRRWWWWGDDPWAPLDQVFRDWWPFGGGSRLPFGLGRPPRWSSQW